jgi:hypothetical protein
VDNPAGAGAGVNLAVAAPTSKSPLFSILPGVSFGELDQYVEYVPRLAPRSACSSTKRGHGDGTSTSVPTAKRAHQLSTLLGIQVIGSMVLGEHIHIFVLSATSWFSYLDASCCFLDGTVVHLLKGEEEEEDDSAALVTHR